MATNYPSAYDTFNNPAAGDSLSATAVTHHLQHANINDAVSALQRKVGNDNAPGTATLDYLLKNTASTNPGHWHTTASLSGVSTGGGGGVPSTGLVMRPTAVYSATVFTASTSYDLFVVSATGTCSALLPEAVGSGRTYYFVNVTNGGVGLNLSASGANTINTAVSVSISQYATIVDALPGFWFTVSEM